MSENVVGVVFSYVFLGGTYAHAYTNTAQGAVMLVVACLIFVAAMATMGSPAAVVEKLAAQDPNLTGLTYPGSPFYRHWAEVLVCPFIIGFALVAQPHLLVKTLYLKETKDLAKFGLVGFGSVVVASDYFCLFFLSCASFPISTNRACCEGVLA